MLLRDGRRFEAPSPSLLAAAARLEQEGVIRAERCVFVRCADPRDSYAPRSSRHCGGKVYLAEGLDEAGHEVRCPACERPVFPNRRGMRRHEELCTHVVPEGISTFVGAAVECSGTEVKRPADCVWRIDVGTAEVFVCIVDYCGEPRYMDRAWAKTRVVCYVAVDSVRLRTGFLNEEWVTRVAVADLVAGQANLPDVIRRSADAGPPTNVSEPPVQVYAHRTSPAVLARSAVEPRQKQLVVEVRAGSVWIEGVEVVAEEADAKSDVFRILWNRFVDDLRERREADAFAWLSVEQIANQFGALRGTHISDVNTVRRTLNRLRRDIETRLKKEQRRLVVALDDVIEARAKSGQCDTTYGYRINPRTVLLRPPHSPSA